MKDEAKYNELLKELGSILHDKNREIYLLQFQVSELLAKLEEAKKKK